jgi:hypothetical protein
METRGAITLDDVIVFKDDNWASNVEAWAHELEHVRQYDILSVDGFAQAYLDQTCIIPGDSPLGGVDSDKCKLERYAYRKDEYWNQAGFVSCCLSQSDAPLTLVLRDRVLNGHENFTARESIIIGPNVVLQPGGDVTLRAGGASPFRLNSGRRRGENSPPLSSRA